MAHVTVGQHQDIGWQLDRSLAQWRCLPTVETEIDGWNLIEQIRYVEEWTLEEERLLWLERQVAEGIMTPDQSARYGELQALVAAHRPIIRRLRES